MTKPASPLPSGPPSPVGPVPATAAYDWSQQSFNQRFQKGEKAGLDPLSYFRGVTPLWIWCGCAGLVFLFFLLLLLGGGAAVLIAQNGVEPPAVLGPKAAIAELGPERIPRPRPVPPPTPKPPPPPLKADPVPVGKKPDPIREEDRVKADRMEAQEKLVEKWKASIPMIVGENDVRRGHGTGVLIAPQVVASNLHNVDGFRSSEIRVVFRSELNPKGDEFAADILFRCRARDLVLLHVRTDRAPLPLAKKPVRQGEEIAVIGNPRVGDVRGLAEVNRLCRGEWGRLHDIRGQSFFELLVMDVEPGNSGGPVLDPSSGSVLGLVTLKLGDDKAFAIPYQEVEEALLKIGPPDFWPARAKSVNSQHAACCLRFYLLGTEMNKGVSALLKTRAFPRPAARPTPFDQKEPDTKEDRAVAELVDLHSRVIPVVRKAWIDLYQNPHSSPEIQKLVVDLRDNYASSSQLFNNDFHRGTYHYRQMMVLFNNDRIRLERELFMKLAAHDGK